VETRGPLPLSGPVYTYCHVAVFSQKRHFLQMYVSRFLFYSRCLRVTTINGLVRTVKTWSCVISRFPFVAITQYTLLCSTGLFSDPTASRRTVFNTFRKVLITIKVKNKTYRRTGQITFFFRFFLFRHINMSLAWSANAKKSVIKLQPFRIHNVSARYA